MRLIIVAGLLMGVSLAIQSVHSANASARVARATSAVRAPVSAPWYIAMNAGHSAKIYYYDTASSTMEVANLLQNACKFTHSKGLVVLRAYATADRVLIDGEDECGGLPPGAAGDLFRPFEQRGANRTGMGLGLAICHRGVRANGGEIHVVNHPGAGCIFTVELPRLPPPAPA